MNEGNNIYSAMFFPSEVFDLIICYSDDLIALKYFMRELREFTVIPWNMTFLKTIDNQISNRNIRYINRLRRSEIYVELTNMVLKLMDIDLLNDAYYDVLVYYDRNADKLDPGQSYQELDVWHDYEWIYNGEGIHRDFTKTCYPFEYKDVTLYSQSILFNDILPFTFGKDSHMIGKDAYNMFEDVFI
ncbi:hypothetical protein HK099_001122 [Clydaea vesicula]|uniref:Uncharacterized protein n=1 Tax=Clydaea vesicula TaxID=447962 RepID=A0AAD5Y3W7_9FUNG|nr:hypothetical protein HK099_001122 [Clydaea vesicula]